MWARVAPRFARPFRNSHPKGGAAVNRDSYNAIAEQWDDARRSFVGRERDYLDLLLAEIDAPGRVLDVGCGSGRPLAEHVLACGHDVTGVDQSTALLALARRRFPGARWIEADVREFSCDEQFDAIVMWDCLFHVEREWQEPILERLTRMLRPSGRLMLTVGGSAHPAFVDSMFGQSFFYDSHPPETVLALLQRVGLVPLLAEFMNPPTDGRDKGRYAIVASLG
jgi:SAM-dependent methyltransferase